MQKLDSTMGSLTLTDITLQNGLTTGALGGAGLLHHGGALTLTRVVIQNNMVTVNSAADGGGLNIDFDFIGSNFPISITDSTFNNNSSSDSAGGFYYDTNVTLAPPVSIVNTTFSNNTAVDDGGAIFFLTTNLTNALITITNSTISDNSAGDNGGGVHIASSGSLTINNSTIVNNSAVDNGGGLSTGTSNAVTRLNSSIVANNTAAAQGPDIRTGNSTLTSDAGHNLIENTTDTVITGNETGNVIGIDPNLGALANNGGPNMTHLPNAGSPAIDTGDNTTLNLANDQRGGPRTVNAVDIGAVEVGGVFHSLTVTDTGTNNAVVTGFGINCTSTAGTESGDCTQTYADGTSVVMTATATSGSFNGFSGTGSAASCSTSPCTFTINADSTLDIEPAIAAQTVNLSVSSNTSSEAAVGTAITVTATTDSAVSGNQTVDLVTSGTATIGADYTLTPTTITINDGQTTGTATFSVVDDPAIEANEVATLTLSNASSGIVLGTTTSQNITVVDNDFPSVTLSADANAGTEAAGTVITLTATASQAVNGDQTVSIGVSGTGITAGDFTLSDTTITIPGGQTEGSVTFTVQDDALVEGSETANLTISNPSAGLNLGTGVTQDIAITDNDFLAEIDVQRPVSTSIADGGNDNLGSQGVGPVTIDYTIENTGTAALNITNVTASGLFNASSFAPVTGLPLVVGAGVSDTLTVGFDVNAVGPFSFNMDIINDDADEGVYDIALAGFGTLPTTPVNLSVSAASGTEAIGSVITVTATADSAVSGDQTVDLAVTGTGITGGDFSLSNATITILNGQTTGSVTFTVQDDADIEGPETATLTISNPSAGLVLGAALTQDITITDNDFTPFQLLSFSPSANAGNVSASANIVLTFDAVVDLATVNAANIVVTGNQTGLIEGVFSGGGTTMISFNPSTDFKPGEIITVTVTAGLETSGSVSVAPQVFHFSVVTALVPNPLSTEQIVSTTANGAQSVSVGDLDGDGDLDILSASAFDDTIAWYENNGAADPVFTEIIVSTTANFAASVSVGDVDGDGDLDILSASAFDDTIAWYENNGAADPVFTEIIVSTTANFAASVSVGDVDGDGDLDILSASVFDDTIAWYENNGAADPVFTQVIVSTTANGAASVSVGDVDGDGDLDILSASANDDTIAWYENNGAADPVFTKVIVSTTANGAASVSVGDVDGDGDLDILSASANDDTIAWYENNGAADPVFTEIIVSTTADNATSVSVGDVDGDGDLDILSASAADDTIAWYENNGAADPVFTEVIVSTTADDAESVSVGDVDGDGDLDILSASFDDDTIAWYETEITREVNLSVSAASGTEAAATAITVTATADGAVIGDQTVDLAVTGTGITSGDFSLSNATITILNGQTTGSVTFTVQDDSDVEGPETATLTISNPSSGINLGAGVTQDITITDNDFTSFQLLSASPIANAGNVSANANIVLTFDAVVDLATVNAANIVVTGNQTGLIEGVFSGGGGTIIIFNPSTDFKPGEIITVTVTTGLESSGSVLVAPQVLHFSVITAPVPNPLSTEQIVSTTADGAQSVSVGDLDGDGDLDILLASAFDDTIAWYENNGAADPVFTEIIVSTTANFAASVSVGDVDGDGDLDILSASVFDDTIAWYENNGAADPVFTQVIVSTTANGAASVSVGDVDGDGDLDILLASANDDTIAWYENNGAADPVFTEIIVSTTADNARNVNVGDVDGDGDLDILSASFDDDTIAWYENNGAADPVFTKVIVSTTADGTRSVSVGDVDGDGDLDILSASFDDDTIAWYENNGAADPVFTEVIVSTTASFAASVSVGDVDGDGDLDILSASAADDTIAWYENNGAADPVFTEVIVSTTADDAVSVSVGDVDGDGDLDILSASAGDDTIAWYETEITREVNLSVSAASGTEAAATAITVTATADGAVIGDQTVDLAVTGTGITSGDFSLSNATITILNGQTTGSVTFTVQDDSDVEGPETATLTISNPSSGINLGAGVTQDITITDNDFTSFQLLSASPIANAGNVSANANIVLTFDAVVDLATVNAANIVVTGNQTGLIEGVFSGGGGTIIIFNPSTDFKPGEIITVTVTTGLESSGSVLVTPQVLHFSVITAPVPNPLSTEQIVSTTADGAQSVSVGDLDGDGDLDILLASAFDDTIAWYENNGAADPVFTQVIVSTTANGAASVSVGDMDGDGDLDILSASVFDDTIAWYENNGAADPVFTQVIVSTTADDASSVSVGDVDGDGDLDILSASNGDSTIAWYENNGAADPVFTQVIVSTTAFGAISVSVGDVDGDGDLDILSASFSDDTIAWYENNGAADPVFTEVIVSTTAFGAISVSVGDVDGDGDLDILSASFSDDTIAWYENNGAADPVFTEVIVSTTADGAESVSVGDVDGDGDLDILSASAADNTIAWYENNGAADPVFTEVIVSTTASFAASVSVGDVDGDGDLDILSASAGDDTIAWYETEITREVNLSVSASVGAEATGSVITVTATASAAVTGDQTVDLGVSGTGITASDFTLNNTTITILDGQTTGAVTFTIQDDAVVEATETATLTISNPSSGLTLGTTRTQNITIVDNDFPSVNLSVSSNTGTEAAQTLITVTATASQAVSGNQTVNLGVSGSGITGTDFNLSNSTITIPGGQTEGSVTFTVQDDALVEGSETANLTISNPSSGLVLGTTVSQNIVITDNDNAAVTITDVSGSENGGTITVTATLDNAIQGGFTVDVSTADGTATTADNDYTAITNQTLTFVGTAGEQQTFTVTPTGDTKLEANETITVSQTNLVPTTLSVNITDGATVTITNDDAAAVTIADTSGNETDTISFGDSAATITVTATLDNAVQGGFTVDVSTADGTATIADSDYTAVVGQTLTFAGNAGETRTFTITPTGDTKLEANETVAVSQGNLAATSLGVVITDGATVTINNDDDAAVTIADISGNENDGPITVTATLDNAVQGGFTVDVNTADGTATIADSDYTAVTGQTLTFAGTAGETQTFTVTPTGDTELEANETVTVSQSNLAATSLGVVITDGATVTITNDDAASVTIANVSGNENGGTITVTATLNGAIAGGFTVDVNTADGTATTGDNDYTAVTSQTLTFAGTVGETQTFTVTPTGDTGLEADETLTVSLSNLANAALPVNITDSATVTITNDDAAAVTIADISGNENDGAITVTATLDNAVQGGFTVDVNTADGTATITDSDYTAVTSETLTFAGTAGETQTFTVTPTGDTKLEADETVTVSQGNLAATSLGVVITDGATVTITNDDAAAVTIADISGNENDGAITVTATLDNAVQGGFTVDVSTADGTATTADSDYTAVTDQTLTFTGTAGEIQTFTVTPTGDANLEADETVTVSQGNLAATSLGIVITDSATVTITNDDAAAVTIADISGNENDGAITVTATLDNAVQGGFTVDVSTADGIATIADSDYTAVTSETLTFAGTAGETQTFTVTPTGDTKLEANETVTVSQGNLAATSLGVVITDGATVTITNDDAAAVTIADASGNETDTISFGDSAATITVTATLDNAVQGGFTVDVNTADGTATIADSDYTAVIGQTLTFAGNAGETRTFTIAPTGDTKLEANETVAVSQGNLAATSLGVVITDGATVTINNDDDAAVTIADISGNENDGPITVTATLDNAVQGGFTADVNTADGTATIADSDYTAVTGQTLTFAGTAGETQTFTVTPTGDTELEANETVTVSQSNLAATSLGVVITDGATVTITNDDAAAVTIADVSGNENDGAITVTATLNGAIAGGFTVDVSTADGTATTGDNDYTAVTGQTLTFAGTVGETQTFTVTPTGDTGLEADETLTVSLSNLANAALPVNITDSATVTITNDDAAAVTIADISGNENDGAITVTATLDNAVQGGFTVDVNTADGTATITDSDYTAVTSETLTFAGTAGETQTFTVTPTGDTKLEADETVTVSQGNLAATSLGVVITDGATVTITNDDAAAVTIADISGNENDGAITVTATLDNAVQGGFTVDVSTADGTATTADSDYTAVTDQTLTFTGTAGEIQTFTVTPTGDANLEADETVTVSQGNLAATSLGIVITDSATVTITNDDAAAVTIADISGNENDGAITVTATLDNAVQGGFTVDVSTADGTATIADSDYTAVTSETLTFAGTAGETQTFTVTPTGDTGLEANETITVSQGNLTATTSVDITDGATVTITNDDAAAVTITDISGNENDGAITGHRHPG